jgi:hypothetical protein
VAVEAEGHVGADAAVLAHVQPLERTARDVDAPEHGRAVADLGAGGLQETRANAREGELG